LYCENPNSVKLAPLLAEFLYQNKRLDLPGIGTFRLNTSALNKEETSRNSIPELSSGISFEANTSLKESPELINYISSQTGKMKALAAADLDSHLELAQQFINIGKPFLFEGIGSLIKTKSGNFEFASGESANEKIKEYSGKEITATSTTEDSFTEYQNIFSPKKIKLNWQKPVIFLLIIAGIGLAIWGGYMISKKRVSKNNTAFVPEKSEETTPVLDTASNIKKEDSIIVEKPVIEPDKYKFVVEVATKQRGLYRYDMLKGFGLDIQMDTKDSLDFNLFFNLPAAAKDTARIMDSLRLLYTPYWSRSYVGN
jgi:hypothetical protein